MQKQHEVAIDQVEHQARKSSTANESATQQLREMASALAESQKALADANAAATSSAAASQVCHDLVSPHTVNFA